MYYNTVMKRIIFVIIGIFFMILGLIGLMLPVIPQVPFLVLGALFLMRGSRWINAKITGSELYKEHIEEHIAENKFCQRFLSDSVE